MVKSDFVKLATEAGYTPDEVQGLVDLHEKDGIPYDMIPLLVRDID